MFRETSPAGYKTQLHFKETLPSQEPDFLSGPNNRPLAAFLPQHPHGKNEMRKRKREGVTVGVRSWFDKQAQSLFPNGGSAGDLELPGETVYSFLSQETVVRTTAMSVTWGLSALRDPPTAHSSSSILHCLIGVLGRSEYKVC